MSRTGPALTWYMSKDVDAFKSWDDVVDAFLKQYQFNLDVVFSRDDLERTEKKKSESFKEYATRWRNLAAQVTPELTDHEQMKLFIKSLPYEYRHHLVGAAVESLNRLVPIGERIEVGLRDGWFTDPASTSKRLGMKNEKEPLTDGDIAYTQTVRPSLTIRMSGGQQPASNHQQSQRRSNKKQFTPLPGFLSQVLTILRKKNLLSAEPKRPNSENFSNYDLSKKCDYHMGEIGHSTDGCYALKHRVQNLLNTKAFSFQTPKPNVQNNPLSEHESEVNAIFDFDAGQVKNVRVYVTDVYDGLVRVGYHPKDEIPPLALKNRVQNLLDVGAFTLRAPWLCYGRNDLLVIHASALEQPDKNSIPDGWNGLGMPTLVKRGGDELDFWNDKFGDFFIGAMDEGLVEGMGTSPLE